jgi:hypothetical protein
MVRIGRFTVTESVVLPGRGRCVIGDLEGSAEIGGRMIIEIEGEKKDLEIATVEMGNNASGEFFVILGFNHPTDEEKNIFDERVIGPCVVEILGTE